jgi:hypothetical protein
MVSPFKLSHNKLDAGKGRLAENNFDYFECHTNVTREKQYRGIVKIVKMFFTKRSLCRISEWLFLEDAGGFRACSNIEGSL